MNSGFFGGGNKDREPHLSAGDQREPGEIWHEQQVDWNRWKKPEKRRGCRFWPFNKKNK